MVSQLHAELAEGQQKSAEAAESMQGAIRAQADRAEQQLSQAAADLEEAREESEQVLAPSDYDSNISLIFELTYSIILLQILAQMACKPAAQECLQLHSLRAPSLAFTLCSPSVHLHAIASQGRHGTAEHYSRGKKSLRACPRRCCCAHVAAHGAGGAAPGGPGCRREAGPA